MEILSPWKHAYPLPLPGPCHSGTAKLWVPCHQGCHAIPHLYALWRARRLGQSILDLGAEWGETFWYDCYEHCNANHREDTNTFPCPCYVLFFVSTWNHAFYISATSKSFINNVVLFCMKVLGVLHMWFQMEERSTGDFPRREYPLMSYYQYLKNPLG